MVSKRYSDFFRNTDEGKEFISKLEGMIKSQHDKAETNPDMSRDYSQRARGIREVVSEINRLCIVTGEDDVK